MRVVGVRKADGHVSAVDSSSMHSELSSVGRASAAAAAADAGEDEMLAGVIASFDPDALQQIFAGSGDAGASSSGAVWRRLKSVSPCAEAAAMAPRSGVRGTVRTTIGQDGDVCLSVVEVMSCNLSEGARGVTRSVEYQGPDGCASPCKGWWLIARSPRTARMPPLSVGCHVGGVGHSTPTRRGRATRAAAELRADILQT